MKVHDIIPYSLEKNLGKAYNEDISLIPDDDWIIVRDADTCFLTPDGPAIIHQYITRFPDTKLFTCFTNRVTTLSPMQLLSGQVDEDFDIKNHVFKAMEQKKNLYNVTSIETWISGFLMVFSKKTWKEFPFREDYKCLKVDNNFSRRILANGHKIMRMNGLYVFHLYRAINGIFDKTHLR